MLTKAVRAHPHVVPGDEGQWLVTRRAYEEDLMSVSSFPCVCEAMRFADSCDAHESASEYELRIVKEESL